MRALKVLKWVSAGLLPLLPTLSHALELDYYTYNGFEETVSAFQRLALMMNDPLFMVVAGIIVLLGLFIGSAVVATRGLSGMGAHPIGWAIPILLGMAIFKGLVLPKGTIQVYDPVRNAAQAVGDVPDIVVAVAGTLNLIERQVVNIVDSAALHPFAHDGGGINYSLMLSGSQIGVYNTYLDRSLSRYYKDCGTFAMQAKTNGADEHLFRRGTTDLGIEFAKFVSGSISTEYWPTNGDPVEVLTCTDAWTNLNAELNNIANYDEMRATMCRQAGFNPSDAAQMARCDEQIAQAGELFGLPPGPLTMPVLRSFALAHAVTNALNDSDFTIGEQAIVNRDTMAQAEGASQAMNQWIPRMRSFMTALAISLLPILALLIPTPAAMRAIAFALGLFLFLTVWGVTDVIASSMVDDAAQAAFQQVKEYHLGYDAIMNAPTAAVQALGVFGKARGFAMGIATAIAGSVFLFGGFAFASQAQAMASGVESEGEKAGSTNQLPEQRASMQRSMGESMGPTVAMAAGGFDTMAADSGMNALGQMRRRQNFISESLARGATGAEMVDYEARYQAGEDVGRSEGARHLNDTTPGGVVEGARASSYYNRVSNNIQTRSRAEVESSTFGIDESAAQRGALEGATASINKRIYDQVNEDENLTPEGAVRMQTMRSASEIGLAEAVAKNKRNVEVAVDRYREPHQEEIARTSSILQSGTNMPERIGNVSAVRTEQSTRAFEHANVVLGSDAQQSAATFDEMQRAERGAAARESGRADSIAMQTARASFAQQWANSKVLQAATTFIGLQPSNLNDLTSASVARDSSSVRLALSGAALDNALTSMTGQGLMSPQHADQLLRNGSAVIDVAMNGTTPLTARVFEGSSAEVADSFVKHHDERDTTDYTTGVTGASGVLTAAHLSQQFEDVYGGDIIAGSVDNAKLAALASQIGASLDQQGYGESAHDGHDRTLAWRAGVNGELKTPLKSAIGGAGAYSDASHARMNNYGLDDRENLNITRSRQLIEKTRSEVIAEYDAKWGEGAAEKSANREELNNYFASEMAKRVIAGQEKIIEQQRERTSDARKQDGTLANYKLGAGSDEQEQAH